MLIVFVSLLLRNLNFGVGQYNQSTDIETASSFDYIRVMMLQHVTPPLGGAIFFFFSSFYQPILVETAGNKRNQPTKEFKQQQQNE